jgi:hypothetical protein
MIVDSKNNQLPIPEVIKNTVQDMITLQPPNVVFLSMITLEYSNNHGY